MYPHFKRKTIYMSLNAVLCLKTVEKIKSNRKAIIMYLM